MTEIKIKDLNITAAKKLLKMLGDQAESLCKDVMLQPYSIAIENNGSRKSKYYPPELEPFYQYFRHKLIRLQGEFDSLVNTLTEFEDMKDSIETLIAFQNNKV